MLKDVMFWTDVETTGLSTDDSVLLEIAVIPTTKTLEQLTEPFQATVRYTEDEVAQLKAKAPTRVRKMHTETGLWDRLPQGLPLAELDQKLKGYLSSIANPQQGRIAGNSVRLDLNFIEEYLPESYKHLHYRSVDMSALQFLATSWYDIPVFEKKLVHSALSDIEESIEQAKYLRDNLRDGPPF